MTTSMNGAASPYVRLLDRVGGMPMVRALDEGEQMVVLESGHIGHILAQYSCYLLAIIMAMLGDRSVALWSALLLVVPAVTHSFAGMYGYYKRRTLGLARLSVGRQMLAGIPVFALCLLWLAVFVTRLPNLSLTFKVVEIVITALVMVVLSFVLVRVAQQEQQRIDQSVEDDDEF